MQDRETDRHRKIENVDQTKTQVRDIDRYREVDNVDHAKTHPGALRQDFKLKLAQGRLLSKDDYGLMSH